MMVSEPSHQVSRLRPDAVNGKPSIARRLNPVNLAFVPTMVSTALGRKGGSDIFPICLIRYYNYPTVSTRRTYQVTSFSASLLEGPPPSGLWGEVIATFRRSCYVLGVQGKVMCVADQQLDDGPLTMRVDFPPPGDMEALGITVGTPLQLEEGDFLLGREVLLCMAGASSWVPPGVVMSASSVQILRLLQTLVDGLKTDVPDAGLAPLLRHAENLANGRQAVLRCESRMAHFALPAAVGLVNGVWTRDERAIDAGVHGLVGLGPGLTPSGDDLLGGMMVGLITTLDANASGVKERRTQRDVRADWRELVATMAGAISRHAADGTTAISAALLIHAAAGIAAGAVHRLLQALFERGATSSPVGAALAVARTGHTSGWDCLAGVLLGVHLGLRLSDEPKAGYAKSGRPGARYSGYAEKGQR